MKLRKTGTKFKTSVYVIPDYDGLGNDYCGITSGPLRKRMVEHGILGKKNTDNGYIMKTLDCRKEALEFEKEQHAKGMHGGRVYTKYKMKPRLEYK